jgi:hypothetical protein
VQVDPIKPKLKPPGTNVLTLNYDKCIQFCFNFDSQFNSRRYTKAGLTATLPARAAVIAAANPVQGHYNRSKTVNENLKMSPALLSRFDLCFILMDTPDEVGSDSLFSNFPLFTFIEPQGVSHGELNKPSPQFQAHRHHFCCSPRHRMPFSSRLEGSKCG